MFPGMTQRPRKACPVLAFALALALPLLGMGPAQAAAAPLKVTASIRPVALLVAAVGGDRVTVHTLLPPGASPHGYEPTPSQVRDLAGADLLVVVGAGLDLWAERLHRAVGKGVPELELAGHTRLLPSPVEHHHEGGEDHDEAGHNAEEGHPHDAGGDPHVWLDPVRVRDDLVPAIVQALSAAAPSQGAEFARRGTAFRDRLTALDAELTEGLKPVAGRAFVAFHASFTYFAARYGLRQVAVVEPLPGREPSARWMRQVIEAGRESGARAVLTEPQFNPRIARTIAGQFGARVVTVDPLGGPDVAGDGYAGLMRFNLAAFRKALGG
jgi:ABC-type Zn uptake system ZnuABC Zn-binding protein ZnuA